MFNKLPNVIQIPIHLSVDLSNRLSFCNYIVQTATGLNLTGWFVSRRLGVCLSHNRPIAVLIPKEANHFGYRSRHWTGWIETWQMRIIEKEGNKKLEWAWSSLLFHLFHQTSRQVCCEKVETGEYKRETNWRNRDVENESMSTEIHRIPVISLQMPKSPLIANLQAVESSKV